MAFQIKHFSVLAYANGFTLWHYKAHTETLDTVTTKDFFAAAADMFSPGDMVMVSAQDGGRVLVAAPHEDELVITVPLS